MGPQPVKRVPSCPKKFQWKRQCRLPIETQILLNVDFVPTNFKAPKRRAKFVIMEDNDAVIKMMLKGRSPNLRHVTRTHRVDLDWLFERIRQDPGIFLKYVKTRYQIGDLLTKGAFTAELWRSHALWQIWSMFFRELWSWGPLIFYAEGSQHSGQKITKPCF